MRFVFWIAFGIGIGFALSRFNRTVRTWTTIAFAVAGAIGGGIGVHQLGWGREEDLPWTLVGAIAGAVLLSFVSRLFGARQKSQTGERKAA
jgi:uncharacterized protein YcfJ